MTREEASRHLHNDWYIENGHLCVYENARDLFLEAVGMGIKALRPVSREQVEKAWRGEWNYSHTTETDHFAVVKCSRCGHEAFGIALYVAQGNFCPQCGAAQTDEAVDMVMERWEALYEET